METLPPEIMSYLLEFLPLNYRMIMATMNRSWYYASLSPALQRKVSFVYTEPTIKQLSASKKHSQKYDRFKRTMVKSKRSKIALKLQKFNYSRIKDVTIFENLGDRIISINLVKLPQFTGTYLNAITSYCKNLETLEFERIPKFSDFNQIILPLPKLKNIDFRYLNNFSDRTFNLIIQCAPNLEHLSVNRCRIIGNMEIIQYYYPALQNQRDFTYFNSKRVFTYINILYYLNTTKNLKSLNLGKFSNIFNQLSQHIKLSSLQLNGEFCGVIDPEELSLKLAQHSSLKRLEITNIPISMLPSISKLYNLNYLCLTYWVEIPDERLNGEDYYNQFRCLESVYNSFKHLKYLKTLKMYEVACDNHLSPMIRLPKITKGTFSSLKDLEITIDYHFPLKYISKNLECLRIPNCHLLEYNDYETLFNNAKNLRILELYDCKSLTDDVLITSISNIKGLTTLSLFNTKLTYSCLRHIRLGHLQKLTICISLELCISSGAVTDFEESLRCLGYSNPMLQSICIQLHRPEKILIRNNFKLYRTFSDTKKFKSYFRNLKDFEMSLK